MFWDASSCCRSLRPEESGQKGLQQQDPDHCQQDLLPQFLGMLHLDQLQLTLSLTLDLLLIRSLATFHFQSEAFELFLGQRDRPAFFRSKIHRNLLDPPRNTQIIDSRDLCLLKGLIDG